MHKTLPQPTVTRRVGMTNETDLPTAAVVNFVVLSRMFSCRYHPRYILLTTDVPPTGPEQATGAASRPRLRAHRKLETTPGTQEQQFGL